MTIVACSIITVPAYGEIREYLLGDIDDFVPGDPEDDVYFDPDWLAEVTNAYPLTDEVVDFDQVAGGGGKMIPFSFVFDIAGAEQITGAWLAIHIKAIGGVPQTDFILLDQLEPEYNLTALGWAPPFDPSVLTINLSDVLGDGEVDLLPLLADGLLNCVVLDDSAIDYAMLTLSISPDCNTNGIPDECDVACGTSGGPCDVPGCGQSSDCQPNGIPDECDILPPATSCCEAHPEPGCDSPTIETCVCLVDPYCCDTEWDRVCVDEVTAEGCGLCDNDCNTNSIPDDCEPDFDGDGLIDDCDSDIDDDGVLNDDDVCDYTPLGAAVDAEGRPLGDLDEDCDTDLDDYALFQQGFTGPGS